MLAELDFDFVAAVVVTVVAISVDFELVETVALVSTPVDDIVVLMPPPTESGSSKYVYIFRNLH